VKIILLRWSALAFVGLTLTVVLSGCILPGGGYGYGGEYYEPYGVDYGGWGPDYRVAPFRGGDHHPGGEGGHGSAHAYRAAPASHSMPSIPSSSRSGGSRSGGGSRSR
jgi:hypothetical protein